MKSILEGSNSRLEIQKKSPTLNRKKKKEFLKMRTVGDTIKNTNIHIIGVGSQEKREREKEQVIYLKK